MRAAFENGGGKLAALAAKSHRERRLVQRRRSNFKGLSKLRF
ncbi:hypothetical protein RTCIAT899_PB00580 (plasmid) [Rhizobium tropici CIAT 899]|nr:hypothetical protein RTCIAT899_PB00580 [Rhizobium tropici CIAT 899]